MENNSILTQEIFSLFLKYPVSNIPIIENKQINEFISKEKIFRKSNINNFLDTSFSDSINDLTLSLSIETFFTELNNYENINNIPTIIKSSKNITINIYSLKDFKLKFRPLKTLSINNINHIFINYYFPIVILNSEFDVLFENEKIKSVSKKLFSTNIDPSFLNSYLYLINKEEISKISNEGQFFQTQLNEWNINYHIQTMEIEESLTYLITLLRIKK